MSTIEIPQIAADKISVHDFYFETPLYTPVKRENIDGDVLSGTVDGFSSVDKRDTTYSIHATDLSDNHVYYDYFLAVRLRDKRTDAGDMFFFLFDYDESLIKVGQAPATVTLQSSELTLKYGSVLDKEDLMLYKRAIGLAAHGTGIGSFVYLRRIFERLIKESFETHKKDLTVEEETFKSQRMAEKVKTLKEYLPESLNNELLPLYPVLSHGVHNMSEDECLKYFSTLKLAIDLLLSQKLELKRKEDEKKEVVLRLEEVQLALKQGKTND